MSWSLRVLNVNTRSLIISMTLHGLKCNIIVMNITRGGYLRNKRRQLRVRGPGKGLDHIGSIIHSRLFP